VGGGAGGGADSAFSGGSLFEWLGSLQPSPLQLSALPEQLRTAIAALPLPLPPPTPRIERALRLASLLSTYAARARLDLSGLGQLMATLLTREAVQRQVATLHSLRPLILTRPPFMRSRQRASLPP
jgi:hypothetical protein